MQQYSLLLKKQKKLYLNFHKEPQKFCKYNIIMRFNFYQYENDTIQQFKFKAIKFTAYKLKSAIKNETEVVLRLSPIMI